MNVPRTALVAALIVVASVTPAPAKMNLPETIDINKVTCGDLIRANALDRAATVMFYWGYEAAKAGVSTFKTSSVRNATEQLMSSCKKNQSQTIPAAMSGLSAKPF